MCPLLEVLLQSIAGSGAAAMHKPSTTFIGCHAECSNIHLSLHVVTIWVQYSQDDVTGYTNIHSWISYFALWGTFAVVIIKAVVEEVQLKVSILLVHRWNQNPKGAKCKVQNNENTLLKSEGNTTGSHAQLYKEEESAFIVLFTYCAPYIVLLT